MPTIGPDPNFYTDKMQQLGQSLGLIANIMQQRRAEREQKEQQGLARTLEFVTSMPELAANPEYAGQVKAKYGKSYPEVGYLLDILANQERVKQEATAGYEDYLGRWEGLENRHRDLGREAQGPAMLPTLGGPMMPPFLPNIPVLQAQQALQTMDPAEFPQMAASSLSPLQRIKAEAGAKLMGGSLPPMPQPFDPTRLTPEDYAMQNYGKLTPQLQQAMRYGPMEELSPIDLEKREEERRGREAKTEAERLEREAAIEAEKRGQKDALARIDRRTGGQLTATRLRAGLAQEAREWDRANPKPPPPGQRERAYGPLLRDLTKKVRGVGKSTPERNADRAKALEWASNELRAAREAGELDTAFPSIVAKLIEGGRWSDY